MEWNESNSSNSNYEKALRVLNLHDDKKERLLVGKPRDKHVHSSTSYLHEQSISSKDIEKAYRRLAREHHPDRGGDEQNFFLLKAARDFLLNGGGTGAASDFYFYSRCAGESQTPFECRGNRSDVDGNTSTSPDDCFTTQFLLRGRSCVRDLATGQNKTASKRDTRILAATDGGLKMVHITACSAGTSQKSFTLTSEAVLCCDFSSDRRFAFAGTATGQIHRYFHSAQCPNLGDAFKTNVAEIDEDDDDVDPLDHHLIGYPTIQKTKKDIYEEKISIVSVIVKDRNRLGIGSKENKNEQIVFAACESPPVIAVIFFRSTSVDTLWNISNNIGGLNRWIGTIDALNVTQTTNINVSDHLEEEIDEDTDVFRIWCGGSNSENEAMLVCWNFVPSNLQQSPSTPTNSAVGEGDEDCWSDSNSDTSSNSACHHCYHDEIPFIKASLGFGSVYSLDDCSTLGIHAAAVGSDIIIVEAIATKSNTHMKGEAKVASSLKTRQILATNHVLYCVKILPKDLQIAACGAGESIMIWSLVTGTLLKDIRLRMPKYCYLSTNCIMTLDWLESDGGASSRPSIVSGGYDGNITLWYPNKNGSLAGIGESVKIRSF